MTATVAVTAQEPSREIAAAEVVLEGLDDVARQRRCVRVRRVGEEGGEVLAHQAVEHRVVRPVREVDAGRSHGSGR